MVDAAIAYLLDSGLGPLGTSWTSASNRPSVAPFLPGVWAAGVDVEEVENGCKFVVVEEEE